MYICGCVWGGVFLFLNFNFILYVNVRNDLIKKNIKIKKKRLWFHAPCSRKMVGFHVPWKEILNFI